MGKKVFYFQSIPETFFFRLEFGPARYVFQQSSARSMAFFDFMLIKSAKISIVYL